MWPSACSGACCRPRRPELAGLDIAFTYRSASTGVLSGGDFVDYYTRPPSGSLAFAIGDVAGKGVDAMATTFVTKFMLRAAVHGGQLSWPTRPGEALQELRNGLLEQPDFDPDMDRFVTVLFGAAAPRAQACCSWPPRDTRRRSWCAPAASSARCWSPSRPSASSSTPPSSRTPRRSCSSARATSSSLFTDGIAELRDAGGRFFEASMGGVLEGAATARAPRTSSRASSTAGERFSARPPADDLAVLCIRLTGPLE